MDESNGSTSNIFNKLEQELDIKIPTSLIKMLTVNGYDNIKLIADITENDINNIELFARNVLPNILPVTEREEYYGIFHSNVEVFEIISGHRKILSLLIDLCKKKSCKKSNSSNITSQRPSKGSRSAPESASKMDNKPCTSLDSSSDLSQETEQISASLLGWINKKCNDEERRRVENLVKKIKITVDFDHLDTKQNLKGKITCFCGTILHTYKISKNILCQRRWILSNFHRHFLQHLKNKNTNLGQKNGNEKKGILHYFSRDNQPKINIVSNICLKPDNENVDNNNKTSDISLKNVLSPKTNLFVVKQPTKKRHVDLDTDQSFITDYFPYLDTVKTFLNEHPDLEHQLMKQIQPNKEFYSSSNNCSLSSSNLLNMLHEISVQNISRGSNNNIYNLSIKKFALYIFYIGGRALYEVLQANLKNVLPSISCLNRFAKQCIMSIEEGYFNFEGLKSFIEERNCAKCIWISEDATRITSKIEYDPTSNKILGFVLPLKDGLPVRDKYVATSAKTIFNFFENNTKSNYAYVVMAQPLSNNTPAFCLAIFGTDNRFTFKDVQERWIYIRNKAKEHGITVVGFSADGDTRLLRAMRLNSVLPISDNCQPMNNWKWFGIHFEDSQDNDICYIQDTVHIATKLRTRLLNRNVVLKLGAYVASVTHLESLVKDYSKDQHLLTSSDLKCEDKMNFSSAKKICTSTVCEMLLDRVTGSQGTAAYLKCMRFCTDAFLKKDISILTRIYYMWYVVFFLRIWRKWITDNPNVKVADNFLSSNCYLSIELNANTLIKLVKKFQKQDQITSNMFMPWIFSSQACEKLFRTLRSMTSTFSTVVNFSMRDILRRLHRIQLLNNITTDLNGEFIFPREKQTLDPNCYEKERDFRYISDHDIEKTVLEALNDSLSDTRNLGMIVEDDSWNLIQVPLNQADEINSENNRPHESNDIVEKQGNLQNNDEMESNIEYRFLNEMTDARADVKEKENDEDLVFDLCMLPSGALVGENLQLQNFVNEDQSVITENSPFVCINVNNKKMIIRKSSLCWLLEEKCGKVSTDRLRRFIGERQNQGNFGTKVSSLCKKKYVHIGDWCLFKCHDNYLIHETETCYLTYVVGKIISFEDTHKEKIGTTEKHVKCIGNWFTINNDGGLNNIVTENFSLCELTDYQCTLPKPDVLFRENKYVLALPEDIKRTIKSKFLDKRKRKINKSSKKEFNNRNTRRAITKKSNSRFKDDTTDSTTTDDSEEEIILDDSTDTETFSLNSESESEENATFREKLNFTVQDDYELSEKDFFRQQEFLKENPSIDNVLREHSNLLTKRGIMAFFKKLHNVHINMLNNQQKIEKILKFGEQKQIIDTYTKRRSDDNLLMVLQIMSNYFKNDLSVFLISDKVTKESTDLMKSIKLNTPSIVRLLDTIQHTYKYIIFMEKSIILEVDEFTEALFIAIALFFNFNVKYPRGMEDSLEFICKYFFNITENKYKKKINTICNILNKV